MTRRIVLAAIAWLLLASPVTAQIMNPVGQFVNVVDSGVACSVNHACATWNIGSSPSVAMQVTGTFTGTLTFEGSADNLTWFTIGTVNLATGGLVTTTTATGQFTLINTGITGFRVRATAFASGGANVSLTRGTAMSALKGGAGGAFNGTTGVFSSTVTGDRFYAGDGTGALPSYSFVSDPTKGMFSLAANALGFSIAGGNVFTIGSNYIAMGAGSDARLTRAGPGEITFSAVLFANLGTPANGTWAYCSDCLANSTPCTGASTGAFAKRLAGAWDCR